MAVLLATLVFGATFVVLGAVPHRADASTSALPRAVSNTEVHPLLNTSLTNAQGSFVDVAMGHLDEPLNTFWQLFYLPNGKSNWTLVTPPGVASNGGLVMAANERNALVVGFRPSNFLTYSPVSITDDGGHVWSVTALPDGLLDRNDALALGGDGEIAALIDGYGPEVMTSNGSASTWRSLVSQESLSKSPNANRCGIKDLTGVTFSEESDVVVGASCARPGVVGIFEETGSSWDLIGPSLSSKSAHNDVEVLDFAPVGAVTAALFAESGPLGTSLVSAWQKTGGTWGTSPPLSLRPSTTVTSVGPDGEGGFFVLVSDGSSKPTLELYRPGGASWERLASPPQGTKTVVFIAATRSIESITVNGDNFGCWVLNAQENTWGERQRLIVPIQYGSSS